MKNTLTFDDAIVTSLVRYSEADCIVRLFCRQHGRLSAFAKNGLKAAKNLGGIVQAPSLARVGLTGLYKEGLARITQIDVLPATFGFSSSLKSFGYACYLAEITEKFIPEREDATEVFDNLRTALLIVASSSSSASLLRAFELQLLSHCGYLPDLTDVVDEPGSTVSYYDPIKGHLLAHGHKDLVEFDETARLVALELSQAKMDVTSKYDELTLRVVGRIFACRLRMVAKNPLRSVDFLRGLRTQEV